MKQPQERAKLSAEQWEMLLSQMVQHGGPIGRVNTARRCVEVGLLLLGLKKTTLHGEFGDRMNQMGIHASMAQRYMGAARRFRDAPDAFFDAIGSATKLWELFPLDEADALAQGKAMHGLTLDLVAQMTVKELRGAVRAALLADYKDAPAPRAPAKASLTVEEERMLRRYRKCNAEGRAALLQVAGLLECGLRRAA